MLLLLFGALNALALSTQEYKKERNVEWRNERHGNEDLGISSFLIFFGLILM